MNISVVLPAVLLGRAIDIALDLVKGDETFSSLFFASIAYVGGCSLNLLTQIGKRWWLRTARTRSVTNMRVNALRGLFTWPMEKLHQQVMGDLMARIIGDTEVFIMGFNEATTELLDTWLFSISLFTVMLFYDYKLALIAMSPVPLALLLSYFSGNWIKDRTLQIRIASSRLTAALQEYIEGIRLIRLFGRAESTTNHISELSEELKQKRLKETRLRLGLLPIYSTLITCGIVFILWQGGVKVVDGILTTGTLVAFLQLYIRFINRGHRLPLFFNRIQAAGIAYDRLEKLLAPPLVIGTESWTYAFKPNHITGINSRTEAHQNKSDGPGIVKIQNLDFTYPGSDHKALNGINLTFPPGTLTAITGPIGSGKTALLQLIAGLYQPLKGSVDRCKKCSNPPVLPQQADLFSGSIRDNITILKMDDAQLQIIIDRCGLTKDIKDFPMGLDTQIGEGGIRLSGGQQQRIALARALASENGNSPGLLLLDDPFASIDVHTERQIIDALRETYILQSEQKQKATIILTSHRLAAFPKADRVILLNEGKIAEMGSHSELMEKDGLYSKIFHAQHRIEEELL